MRFAPSSLRKHGGCISPRTIYNIQSHNKLDPTYETIYNRMVCTKPNIGFTAFLNKFSILDEIKWPEWAIELAIEQTCSDLKAEGIQYSQISLSIGKYMRSGHKAADIAKLISDLFRKYSTQYNITTGLMLSLTYHSPKDIQLECANLINNQDIADRFCGIDLVGDETRFEAEFYMPIFNEWRAHGKMLRAHVGEMPGMGHNVRAAIELLKVDRIAHGIQADDYTLEMAADHQVCFDLALHSNIITGAWVDLHSHPIKRMLDAKCKITLNTDDPIQFMCTLDNEFNLALNNNLITHKQAKDIMYNACIG